VQLAAAVHQHEEMLTASSPHPLLIRARHTAASRRVQQCSCRTGMASAGGGVGHLQGCAGFDARVSGGVAVSGGKASSSVAPPKAAWKKLTPPTPDKVRHTPLLHTSTCCSHKRGWLGEGPRAGEKGGGGRDSGGRGGEVTGALRPRVMGPMTGPGRGGVAGSHYCSQEITPSPSLTWAKLHSCFHVVHL
jgi:hypothetical protein